jgi:hypothetical protein
MSDDIANLRKPPTYGLYFRRYAPFDTFARVNPVDLGGSSEGDKRTTASTSLKVTARTYGCVMFNEYGIVYRFAGTTGTLTSTLLWGDIVGYSKVSMTLVRSTLTGPSLFGFRASTAGAYPLLPASPDIDTIVTARVDFGLRNFLRLNGEVSGDNFPNLEVFLLCYRSGRTALLIDGRTTGGRDTGPFNRLWGSHSNHSLGRLDASLALNEKRELAFDYKVGATTLPDYPVPPRAWPPRYRR